MTAGEAYRFLLYAGCAAGVYVAAHLARFAGLQRSRTAAVGRLRFPPRCRGRECCNGGGARKERKMEQQFLGELIAILAAPVPLLAIAGLPFWRIWDLASVSMLIALAASEAGCLVNGCCGGRVTEGWMRRRYAVRYPARFAVTLAAYGAARIGLGRIRDHGPEHHPWKNIAFSAPLVVAGALVYAFGSDAW